MTRIASPIIVLLLLSASAAYAQSKVLIGGVDQRLPPLINKSLAASAGTTIANVLSYAADLAGQLSLEKEDSKETNDQLTALSSYWTAWCGKHPGCDLHAPAPPPAPK
jgi:hypothetical protein